MPLATAFVSTVGDNNAPVQGVQQIIDPLGGARQNLRPLDYTGVGGTVFGHYRAVSFSGSSASIAAAGVIASLRWADATRLLVLTRLAMQLEVLTQITAAPVFDAQAFVFRGSTGNGTGASSTTLTMTGVNQKTRGSMGTSLFATGGEIRTHAAAVFTAATGKTNDGAPFGAAMWGCLQSGTATGTAVIVVPGANISPPGWQDLYAVTSPYQHPIILVANEGIEVQCITANNTTGTTKYAFLWEWAEVAAF